MKKTRRFVNSIFFVILFSIISLALIQTSCGGGGGGGGGGAAGPDSAPTPTSTSTSQPAETVPLADLSPEAEIISFKFEKNENPSALSEVDDDLIGSPSSSSALVVVPYPFGKLADTPELVPTIEVSEGASIIDVRQGDNSISAPYSANYFDNSNFDNQNHVQITVKAENNTEKVWTVDLNQMTSHVHAIHYEPAGIDYQHYPTEFSDESDFLLETPENSQTLPTYNNYYFVAWYDNESRSGSPVTQWSAGSKTSDVTLYAKLQPAPMVDTVHQKIYANGIPVTVQKEGDRTMVLFNDNGNNRALNTINSTYPDDYSGYTLYAGTSNNTASSNINNPLYGYDVSEGKITITGGTLEDVWGGNSGSNTPLQGGSNLYLAGSPVIGDECSTGIRLLTFSDNVVFAEGTISSADNSITLVAPRTMRDSDIVVKSRNGNHAAPEKYKLLNSHRTSSIGLKTSDTNVVVQGSISLPIQPIWVEGGHYFTLGEGHVNSEGTIFSVFVNNGYFEVPETTMDNADFDMAIPAGNGDNEYIEGNSLTTTMHLQYIQFKSVAGNLSSETASHYLAGIRFYVEDGQRITVNVNLQTVPWQRINERQVTYFNGSFYEVVSTGPAVMHQAVKSWTEAYSEAKGKTFNNLKGYLMTITSKAENMFIYDRVYSRNTDPQDARGWIGATRCQKSATKDPDSWTVSAFSDKWIWACGPEANTEFWTTGTNGFIGNNFASWDNQNCRNRNNLWGHGRKDKGPQDGPNYPTDIKYWPKNADGTPNYPKWYKAWSEPTGGSEGYAQYLGVYCWNDQSNAPAPANTDQLNKVPTSYIVEYTIYGTQQPEYPELKATQKYSRPAGSSTQR
ncbi:MAG: hypothetical protein J6T84_02840 [Spirochaetaceae bacterium]|nr:hypothetical protein [Spirochaetaceae bacterium]